MSKLLRQNQNTHRALELRIEEEAMGRYHVILAGMVVHNQNCRGGTCEGNFMYTDNLTYKVIASQNFDEAEAVYEELKERFLD